LREWDDHFDDAVFASEYRQYNIGDNPAATDMPTGAWTESGTMSKRIAAVTSEIQFALCYLYPTPATWTMFFEIKGPASSSDYDPAYTDVPDYGAEIRDKYLARISVSPLNDFTATLPTGATSSTGLLQLVDSGGTRIADRYGAVLRIEIEKTAADAYTCRCLVDGVIYDTRPVSLGPGLPTGTAETTFSIGARSFSANNKNKRYFVNRAFALDRFRFGVV